jgi:hypothetical protein
MTRQSSALSGLSVDSTLNFDRQPTKLEHEAARVHYVPDLCPSDLRNRQSFSLRLQPDLDRAAGLWRGWRDFSLEQSDHEAFVAPADDLAIWKQFPASTFTLVPLEPTEDGEEYRLGIFDIDGRRELPAAPASGPIGSRSNLTLEPDQ